MQSLLLVSHGSRKEQSNEEVRRLSEKLAEQAKEQFAFTQCAFLELAEPSIPQGLDLCVQAGATQIIVLPYFLAIGRHVSEDIPAEIEKKREQYSHISIKMMSHIGSESNAMVKTLLALIDE